mmetsp:Transcript_18627/g.47950  ORF Transcript_18627/g.47950 Transcript_18627/m.47950 type:complete len:125 (-) Transcript_18627:138-512(-)
MHCELLGLWQLASWSAATDAPPVLAELSALFTLEGLTLSVRSLVEPAARRECAAPNSAEGIAPSVLRLSRLRDVGACTSEALLAGRHPLPLPPAPIARPAPSTDDVLTSILCGFIAVTAARAAA